jgi:ABC-type glutathione transport system ATPase component
MEPLIRMEGIKKVFYTDEVETHALADVHLEIRPGEYIAIAGPSGCGKTTLLSILGLLDTPTDGTYMLSGEHVAKLSAADRARIRNRRSHPLPIVLCPRWLTSRSCEPWGHRHARTELWFMAHIHN